MFNCDVCREPTGPRVKPVLQCVEVPKEYVVQREDEAPEVITGSEIVRELRLCASCAGVPAVDVKPTVSLTVLSGAKAFSAAAKKHVAGCNKRLEECRSCKGIMDYFASMPLRVLNAALEDIQAKPGTLSFAVMAVESLLEQSKRNGRKAKRDFAAGYAVLKNYEKRGGRL